MTARFCRGITVQRFFFRVSVFNRLATRCFSSGVPNSATLARAALAWFLSWIGYLRSSGIAKAESGNASRCFELVRSFVSYLHDTFPMLAVPSMNGAFQLRISDALSLRFSGGL